LPGAGRGDTGHKEQSHVQRRPLYSRSGRLRRIDGATLIAPASSDTPFAPPPPPTRPSFGQRNRRYWSRAYRRHQGKLLVLAGMAMTFVILGAYDAIKGPNLALTPTEFVEVINGVVDRRPQLPAATAIAYNNGIPSVVAISGYDPEAHKSQPPMSPDERPGIVFERMGTGVVVEADGTILTNLHVASGTPQLRITFMDGTIAEGKIVGSQPGNDLAVIKPSTIPLDLKPATMTSATTLNPGDEVLAVGFPFGIGPSASAGIVSGLGRAFGEPGHTTLENLIQFDASTNPGNSGGPLVNANGEVVGIVTALMNPSGVRTFAGIAFAVTIDTAATAVGDNPL
jgi:S1-C subfamily serine protease